MTPGSHVNRYTESDSEPTTTQHITSYLDEAVVRLERDPATMTARERYDSERTLDFQVRARQRLDETAYQTTRATSDAAPVEPAAKSAQDNQARPAGKNKPPKRPSPSKPVADSKPSDSGKVAETERVIPENGVSTAEPTETAVPGKQETPTPSVAKAPSDNALKKQDTTPSPPQVAKASYETAHPASASRSATPEPTINPQPPANSQPPVNSQPTANTLSGTNPPPTAGVPSSHATPPTPKDWDRLVKEAIVVLERKSRGKKLIPPGATVDASSDEPEPYDPFFGDETERLREEMLLRMLHFVVDNREDAVRPVKQLEEDDQEFWNHMLFGLSNYLDYEKHPRDLQRKTLALTNLRRGVSHLASVSNLEVRNAVLCTRVDGYGRYTEVQEYEFRPGQEVLLYVEIDNFSSEQLKSSGYYETALISSYEIRDRFRRRADQHEFTIEKDVCRNRRRDFFIPYRVYISNNLTPGSYTLQLTVQDVKSRRSGQSAPIEFTVRN